MAFTVPYYEGYCKIFFYSYAIIVVLLLQFAQALFFLRMNSKKLKV